jgi:uncharacterized phage protein gp47/JayE
MAYQVPTLDAFTQFLTAYFRGLFPNRNVGSRFAFYWKLVRIIAAAVTDVHAHVNAAGKDFMPDTTSKGTLDRWLAIVGLVRKSATPARKSAALLVTGTAATAIPVDTQLLHRATGQIFKIQTATTISGAGSILADVVGISTGSSTRLLKGETLEFITPIAGVGQYAKLSLALDEDGQDAELDGAAIVRLLKALGEPTSGGNQADFVRWALAVTGISSAYCYPNRAGIGSVDVAALHTGTGTARSLSAGERATLLAALQALAPAQLAAQGGALRVLTTVVEANTVDLSIQTNGEQQYAWDWDDGGAAGTWPVIASWTAGTLTMQFTAARPATMKAGDRLYVVGVTNPLQSGAPVVIQSLVSTDSVILASAPTAPDGSAATLAAGGDKVRAGGPLTSRIRDAVIAHMNSDTLYAAPTYALPGAVAAAQSISTVGMQVLLDGIGTSNPGRIYGAWNGALRRQSLATIATYTRGVGGLVINTPVAEITESTDYAYPSDAQIGMISVGPIYVGKA